MNVHVIIKQNSNVSKHSKIFCKTMKAIQDNSSYYEIYNFRLQNWKSNQLIKHSNSFQLVVQSVKEIDKKNGLLNCRYCMKTHFFLSPFWNYIFSSLYITPNSSPFYVNWIFYWYALNVGSLSKIPSCKQFLVNKSVRKRDSFSKWE